MRNFAVMAFISFLFVFASTGFAGYQVYSDATVIAGQPFYVRGNVSGTNQYNISVNITGNNANNSFSAGGGYFDVNVSAPLVVGEYNVTVMSVNDTSNNKTIRIYVTNLSSNFSLITFTRNKPPFSAGTSFTINITLKNTTNSLLHNYTPRMEIYSANGVRQTSWTIANMSVLTNHTGSMEYNITIPSTADGDFVISADKGNVISIIIVKSNYLMAVNAQTSSNETKFDYTPSSSFNIIAKIRDTSGNAIGNAINTTAKVTKPDGTVDSVTLANDTSVFGQYKGAYTLGSTTGQYKISASGIVGTTTIESSTLVNAQQIKAMFDTQKEFFREWGDSSAFVPGGTVGLIVLATNLSDSSIFSGAANGAGGTVNCANVSNTLVVSYINGTRYVISGAITNDSSGSYFGQSVCRVQFTGPSETGNYKITANITIGTAGPSTIATGYFAIQRFVLKPTAVSSLGGSFDFMTMLHPGENATFDLGAYDLSNNSEVNGVNITNITVTKIIPLEFNAGASDIREGGPQRADVFNTTNITAGSTTKNPTVTVSLPVNKTGPFLIEMEATIHATEANTTIIGRGFYISKYIMGFLSSAGRTDAGSGGPGGGPPGGGFGGFSSCSEGTEKFSGNVRELKTNTAPKDPVSFNGILQAREEFSGRDISSCLTMSTNSSDSSGQITVPVTFNKTKSGCTTLSGFHFMLFNVTYQGREDQIPAGFMCRQYQFWPQGKDANNNSVWRVDSKGSVNFSLDNSNIVRRLNDSASIQNGTVTIVRAFNFNPGVGMQVLTLNTSANLTGNLSNYVMSLVVAPRTFSRETYPNGFIAITWKFTPNASEGTGSDTTETGFQVSAFDAYIMDTERPTTGGACGTGVTCMTNGTSGGFGGFGATFSAGEDVIIWLRASTNVSKTNNTNGGTNLTGGTLVGVQSTTGFTAKVGLPWEGKLKPVTINNASLVTDDWNGSYDTGFPRWGAELWRINVTIPSTLKKGMQALQIEINSSANGNSSEKVTTDVWFSIVKYSVIIGEEEGMTFESNFLSWGNYSSAIAGTGGSTIAGQVKDNTTIFRAGWNLTYINETYNLRSKSDAVCIRNEFNVTRWSQGSNALPYNGSAGMRILVLDNTTAGVYDTVLINGTYPGVPIEGTFVKNITILRIDGLRNISTGEGRVAYNVSRNWTTNLYLWQILDCSYIKWVNTSYTPNNIGSWAGQYEKGVNFTIPYIIKRSSSSGPAVSAATVSFNAVIKQNDASSTGGSATGGFGVAKKLATSEYQSATAVTGSSGLAFVPLNISSSTGSFMLFWRVNESSGQEDIASFQSEGFGGYGGGGGGGDVGTQVQIRAFDTYASRLPRLNSSHATIAIKLKNISSSGTIYGLTMGGSSVYNATWNEATGGQLVENSALDNYTILYNFSLAAYGENSTFIGRDRNPPFTAANISTTFGYTIDGKTFGIGTVRNLDVENLTIAFYEDSNSQAYYPIMNLTQNISVRVCAQTYTKPQKPILNANVYIYAESWSMSGWSAAPTATPLRWYDPINGTPYLFGPVSGMSQAVANATVGPKGCAALNINNPLNWTSYTSYSIKAKVKRTSAADNETDVEDTYVDYVWRSPQCSNGLDDDGDGKVDYISYNPQTGADTQCSSYSDDDEAA